MESALARREGEYAKAKELLDDSVEVRMKLNNNDFIARL